MFPVVYFPVIYTLLRVCDLKLFDDKIVFSDIDFDFVHLQGLTGLCSPGFSHLL